MCVPLLGSTGSDQGCKDCFLLHVHPQAETQLLITREGNSLSRIPPKSQHLILLHSLMWAHLLFTAIRWLPDEPSKTSSTDYPSIPVPAKNKNVEILSNPYPHTPKRNNLSLSTPSSVLHCSCQRRGMSWTRTTCSCYFHCEESWTGWSLWSLSNLGYSMILSANPKLSA